MELLRAELANLGADMASEATHLQVATRRAEAVDDPSLPVNDPTKRELWLQSHAHRVVSWHRCTCDHLAYKVRLGDSRRRRSASGLRKCLDVFPLLQRRTACFGGGVRREQCRHPTRCQPARACGRRHKWQCHGGLRHHWHVQLCPHSLPVAPQPSEFLYSRVSCKECFSALSAR